MATIQTIDLISTAPARRQWTSIIQQLRENNCPPKAAKYSRVKVKKDIFRQTLNEFTTHECLLKVGLKIILKWEKGWTLKEVMEMWKGSGEQRSGHLCEESLWGITCQKYTTRNTSGKFKNKLGLPLPGRQRWIFPIPPAKYNWKCRTLYILKKLEGGKASKSVMDFGDQGMIHWWVPKRKDRYMIEKRRNRYISIPWIWSRQKSFSETYCL